MKKLIPILAPLFSVFLVIQGCIEDPLAATDGTDVTIRLHVTGGIAAADYTVFLDGEERTLVGESCVSLCDFEAGEVLQSLTPEQVTYVWNLFQQADIHALRGEDFGVQCCDQFHFEVDYSDSEGRSTVAGSSEVLPQGLKTALATLQGMVSGVLPVIVDFATDPAVWPQDPFQIQDAAVVGHQLRVRLGFGGGCRAHDLKVVAWGGWMESQPVQVRLFVAHEDFGDPCDAWITRDLELDLIPLKLAYQASYGIGEPGETTLILLLADPLVGNPLGARWLEYPF